jgi:beta-lactamase regulating signal transducer with metallopeptidase domain
MTPDSVFQTFAAFPGAVLEPAARSLVFAGVAGLTLAVVRAKSVALRMTMWRTVLIVALAMPVLGLLMPPLPVFVPVLARFSQAQVAAVNVARQETEAHFVGAVKRSPRSENDVFSYSYRISGTNPVAVVAPSAVPAAARRAIPWVAIGCGVYGAVAIFLLMRLMLGVILGRRLERGSRTIEDREAVARLRFFAGSANLRVLPRLAESEFLSVPVTFGVARPAILLPGGWREWEAGELDAVLAHEISHVVRRDALAERLSLVHRAIFWFSPLSWWLDRHLAELAEEASDDAALAAGADRTRYAETLLGFFAALEAAPGRVWWQGVSMATAGQAEKRVDRILEWKGSVAMQIKRPVVVALIFLGVPVVCLTAAFRPTVENFHSTPNQEATRQEAAPQAPASPQATPAPAVAPLPAPAPQSAPTPAPASVPAPSPVPAALPNAAPTARPAMAPLVQVAPMQAMSAMAPPAQLKSYAPMHTAIAPMAPMAAMRMAPLAAMRAPQLSTTHSVVRIIRDEQYVIVSGNFRVSVSANSFTIGSNSEGGSDFVDSLRRTFPGDFIWFIRDGEAYVIRDAATIHRAMELFAPAQELERQQEELGKKQEVLGAQQEALGKKQEALGEQMEKVRVNVPDLTAEIQKLEAEVKKLGASGTQEDLGRIQEKVGEIQNKIGELQSAAGEQQGALGEKQGALGEEQGKLGEEQGRLGEEQGKLGEQEEEISRKASGEMKKLFDEAMAQGIAKAA